MVFRVRCEVTLVEANEYLSAPRVSAFLPGAEIELVDMQHCPGSFATLLRFAPQLFASRRPAQIVFSGDGRPSPELARRARAAGMSRRVNELLRRSLDHIFLASLPRYSFESVV